MNHQQGGSSRYPPVPPSQGQLSRRLTLALTPRMSGGNPQPSPSSSSSSTSSSTDSARSHWHHVEVGSNTVYVNITAPITMIGPTTVITRVPADVVRAAASQNNQPANGNGNDGVQRVPEAPQRQANGNPE